MDGHRLSSTLGGKQCPDCWFISPSLGLTGVTKPCPSCGATGSRGGYPAPSASRLLDIIQHFHSVASAEHQDDLSCISEKISDLLGRPISSRAVYTGWLKHRQITDHEDVLKTIERFFRCNRENAMNAFQVYRTLHACQPEQTVVPVLTVTLVEILLSDLLRDLKVKRQGMSRAVAQTQVSNLRSFDERFAEFASITGADLAKTIQRLKKPFWDKWVYVRRNRNHFVHGNAYAIDWETCKRAYELAIESIDLFAELNNRFVV